MLLGPHNGRPFTVSHYYSVADNAPGGRITTTTRGPTGPHREPNPSSDGCQIELSPDDLAGITGQGSGSRPPGDRGRSDKEQTTATNTAQVTNSTNIITVTGISASPAAVAE